MPAYLQFYLSDDVTLASATIAAGDVDGGTTFTLPPMHLWNDNGGVHGDTVTATGLLVYASAVTSSGEFMSGAAAGFAIPILDQLWIGAQVVSVNKTGDPTMQDQTTPIVRIGANAMLALGDIPKNCNRGIQFYVIVPPGVSNQPFAVNLRVSYAGQSRVLPLRLGTVSGGGVIPEWIDGGIRRLSRGRVLTANGTANIIVTNGSWNADGVPHTQAKETDTLNQTSGSGTLTSGQAYIARFSQPIAGGVATVTKGGAAASPVVPALPANEIDLGWVNVSFQSGGTSIINTADVSLGSVLYGEFFVTNGGGLNARVGAGNGIATSDSEPFAGSPVLVALSDNATNTVWMRPDTGPITNTTGLAPIIGAFPLADVVTVSGAITTITDRRRFVGHGDDHVIRLRKSGAITATATDFDWGVAPFDAYVMKVTEELGVLGTGVSGSFIGDVTWRPAGTDLSNAGTTLFTSSGADDQRPSIDHAAASLRAETNGYEVIAIPRGARIAGNIAAVPASASGASDFSLLVFLRRQQ